MRRYQKAGLCLISLGIGVLLAMVLPVGVLIFFAAVAMIALGVTWCKRP